MTNRSARTRSKALKAATAAGMPASRFRPAVVANDSPRQRNAVKTQERILAAAQTEFARKGYDGARIDSIIVRAKVSKNLIYHYFGSKEGLYVRVLERIYATLRRKQNEYPTLGRDPVHAMRLLCDRTFDVFVDEPDIIPILNTENLHQGRHVKASPTVRLLYERLASSITAILEDGVKKQVFRPGLDPVNLYISMAGLAYFYLSNRYTLSLLFDRDLKSIENLQQRKAHIADMILRYVSIDEPRS